jgi:hypothetical protein
MTLPFISVHVKVWKIQLQFCRSSRPISWRRVEHSISFQFQGWCLLFPFFAKINGVRHAITRQAQDNRLDNRRTITEHGNYKIITRQKTRQSQGNHKTRQRRDNHKTKQLQDKTIAGPSIDKIITRQESFVVEEVKAIIYLLSYLVLPCLALSCHVMSRHVMSCHVMSCHVLFANWALSLLSLWSVWNLVLGRVCVPRLCPSLVCALPVHCPFVPWPVHFFLSYLECVMSFDLLTIRNLCLTLTITLTLNKRAYIFVI